MTAGRAGHKRSAGAARWPAAARNWALFDLFPPLKRRAIIICPLRGQDHRGSQHFLPQWISSLLFKPEFSTLLFILLFNRNVHFPEWSFSFFPHIYLLC